MADVLRPPDPPPDPPPPWSACFEIRDNQDGAVLGGHQIRIEQVGEATFRLRCRVTYLGETGLEGKPAALRNPDDNVDDILGRLKTVSDAELGTTDLASVPRALLWLVP